MATVDDFLKLGLKTAKILEADSAQGPVLVQPESEVTPGTIIK